MKLAPYWPYVLLWAAQVPCASSRGFLPRSHPSESTSGMDFDILLTTELGTELEPVSTQQELPADNGLPCTEENQDASTQLEPSDPFQIFTYHKEGVFTHETFLLKENWNKEHPFTCMIEMGHKPYEGVIAASTSGAWVVVWELKLADRIIKAGNKEIDELFNNGNGKYKHRPKFTVSQAYKTSVHPAVARGFKSFVDTLKDRNNKKAQTDDPIEILGIIPVTSFLVKHSGTEGRVLTSSMKLEMTGMARRRGLLVPQSERPNTDPLLYSTKEGGRDISIVLEKEPSQTKLIVKVGDDQREFVKQKLNS